MSRVVVIAPDKFKGSLTATQAVQAIQRGVNAADPGARCRLCPMADGGEGTVDVFVERGYEARTVTVSGPLGEPVETTFAVNDSTAVLEMSAASGLRLLRRDQYDPLRTDTYGTGQLVAAALDAGASHLIVGIGGSATNDAGTGMLRALGVRFLDRDGHAIDGPMPAYAELARIDACGLDPRLQKTRIDVASDVDNPLCGPDGAARTFAAQKGASEAEIERLDGLLAHIADVAAQSLGRDCRDAPGAGAAGGLGFALLAFLSATMVRGVELVAREGGLDEMLRGADLCMTGEGKIDLQTLHGKTVAGVAALAAKHGVTTIAFGGAVEAAAAAALEERGVRTVQITPPGMPLDQAMREAATLLERAAKAATAGPAR